MAKTQHKGGSKSRREPLPHYADLILKLQRELGFIGNQAGFARLIRRGLAQGTLSAWTVGSRKPSPEMLWRMGSIAPTPELATSFYEEAGLSKEQILLSARAVWGRKFDPPVEGEIVRVGALPGSEDRGWIIVARDIVPDPNAAYYFVINESTDFRTFCPGIAVLDVTHRGTKLSPFWNKLVLARTGDRYCIGHLMRVQRENLRDPIEQHYTFYGVLSPSGYEMHLAREVGVWRAPLLDRDRFHEELKTMDDKRMTELILRTERESYEMKAAPGVEIIGAIIEWRREKASSG